MRGALLGMLSKKKGIHPAAARGCGGDDPVASGFDKVPNFPGSKAVCELRMCIQVLVVLV